MPGIDPAVAQAQIQAAVDAATTKAQAVADEATEKVCDTIWQANQLKAKAKVELDKAKTKLDTFLAMLRNPAAVLSALGSELLSTVESVASSLATAVMGEGSAALRVVMEKIFKMLLLIFQAGPDAAFSLAWIPLRRARKAAAAEAKALTEVSAGMQTAITMMSKWTSGHDCSRFYNQMRLALPYIGKAISGLTTVMQGLQSASPYFDEVAYNDALSNLKTAFDSTIPISKLDEVFGVSSRANQIKQQYISARLPGITAKRDADLAIADASYRSRVANIYNPPTLPAPSVTGPSPTQPLPGAVPNQQDITPTQGGNTLVDKAGRAIANSLPTNVGGTDGIVHSAKTTAEVAAAEYEWYRSKQHINDNYNTAVWKLNMDADGYVAKNTWHIYKDSWHNTQQQFAADMKILGNSLLSMMSSLKTAFARYKDCQLYTQASYYSLDNVKKIIQLFISMMKSGAYKGATTALPEQTIEWATAILDGVYTMFNKYEHLNSATNATSVSSITASAELSSGHFQLGLAQSILNASITQSLIDIVNLDQVLSQELSAFNAFKKRLSAIPDWNGNQGIWAVDPLSLLDYKPYLQIITSMLKLTTTMSASIGGTQELIQANMSQLSQTVLGTYQYMYQIYSNWNKIQVTIQEPNGNFQGNYGQLIIYKNGSTFYLATETTSPQGTTWVGVQLGAV